MSHERLPQHEAQHEKPQHTQEHLKNIEAQHEQAARQAKPEHADQARHEAQEQARSTAEYHQKAKHEQANTHSSHYDRSAEKLHSFNTTMHHVRQGLKTPERSFSKFIHQPIVEKVSDVAGKTVARPSGILGATIGAFIGLSSVYGIAVFVGFPLSGSEMPILLVLGFAAGLFVEWSYKAIRSLLLAKQES